MTLKDVALFLISLPKRSLSLELSEFFGSSKQVTKSAFCQARQKLKPKFFQDWNDVLVNSYYHHHKENIKRWQGFRIMAVDGSTAYLLNKPALVEEFGVQSNKIKDVPMARLMTYYDTLNNIILKSSISAIAQDELGVALSWVKTISEDTITIYDRGYASFILMYLHTLHNCHFVIRQKLTETIQIKEFVASNKNSEIVTVHITSDARQRLKEMGYKVSKDVTISIRLVKAILDTGEIEVLATSLLDEKIYPTDLFKDLYFYRWKIETQYGVLKNLMQIEIFTGYSVDAIKQDYYATIYTVNLQSVIMKENEDKLKEISKQRKYEYQINRNIALGHLKNHIIELFENNSPDDILTKLNELFLQNIEPIRNGRK